MPDKTKHQSRCSDKGPICIRWPSSTLLLDCSIAVAQIAELQCCLSTADRCTLQFCVADPVITAQGVYKQMVEAFRSLGVEAVPGPGNPFDPEVHEAIMREENDDVPDGTVLKEFRRGFKLGSQLLRAAMVQVRQRAMWKCFCQDCPA